MKIEKRLIGKSKYDIKCPYKMTPKYIVVHNTDNDASADNEIAYMQRNTNYTSFHIAVDDKKAILGIPLNRNAFHASDGATGKGNRYGIAIEICYSKSGGVRFDKAEVNASKVIAQLLKQYGWSINCVKRHYDFAPDKKYCPRRTMDKGWDRFLKMCQKELDALNKPKTSVVKQVVEKVKKVASKDSYKVGDVVYINAIYGTSQSTTKLKPLIKKGKITKIYKGTKNPYLLNGGDGFVNEKCIVK